MEGDYDVMYSRFVWAMDFKFFLADGFRFTVLLPAKRQFGLSVLKRRRVQQMEQKNILQRL
jgi:hypothetical protein